MLPFCVDQGVGVIPWSPLAGGKLTRDWEDQDTARAKAGNPGARTPRETDDADRKVAETVATIAEERGVSRAQIALAWVLSKPAVTAPIVGATKEHHLADAIAAVDLELSSDEVSRLEEHYAVRADVGF